MTLRHFVFAITLLLPGATFAADTLTVQGYIEGEFVQMALPDSGQLRSLGVVRGAVVAEGDILFTLDDEVEAAVLGAAEAALGQAEAKLVDMRKGLRDSEVATLLARQSRAVASGVQSRKAHDRALALHDRGNMPEGQLEILAAALSGAEARIREITAEIETAGLGGRIDQVRAAALEVEMRRAERDAAAYRRSRRVASSPAASLVYDVFYRVGEEVPAGRSVVSLLPPDNLKVRFFVPQSMLSTVTPGTRVQVTCDGCVPGQSALVIFVSPRVEFSPPVIYSQSAREKLVVMIEARPDDPGAWQVGQPVDVTIQ